MECFARLTNIGSLLTPPYPVRGFEDVNMCYSVLPDLLSRYLIVRGTVDLVPTYIHLAYDTGQFGLQLGILPFPVNFEDESPHGGL